MIGKVMKRAVFKGCVNYVLNKQDAKLLSADGVLLNDVKSIIQSFHTQRLLKPNIKDPVGHISLSYSPDDEKRLSDGAMITLAKEYMEQMGIKDTQYILVRHFDNNNPHVHLVYNRINNNGKVISDKNDHYRNEAVCKKLKDKYSLTYGKDKEKVKQQKLRGKDKTKYQVYNVVKEALSKSMNWKDFEKLLKEKGIILSYKRKSNDPNVIQGISFSKGDVTFKGSEVDRKFSYSKINQQLQENYQSHKKDNTDISISPKEDKSQNQNQGASLLGSLIDGIDSLSTPEVHGDNFEEDQFVKRMEYEQEKRNRKNKRTKGRSL